MVRRSPRISCYKRRSITSKISNCVQCHWNTKKFILGNDYQSNIKYVPNSCTTNCVRKFRPRGCLLTLRSTYKSGQVPATSSCNESWIQVFPCYVCVLNLVPSTCPMNSNKSLRQVPQNSSWELLVDQVPVTILRTCPWGAQAGIDTTQITDFAQTWHKRCVWWEKDYGKNRRSKYLYHSLQISTYLQ